MSFSNDKNSNGRFSTFLYISLVILLFAGFVYLGNVFNKHLERWDDAFITFRYAQHLAEGQGLIWNIGGERVEGFTSLLHLGIKIGIDPWLGSLLISVISVLVTVGLMLPILWRQFGTIHPVTAIFIGIYLIDTSTAIHTTSGLETQFFVALLCACYLFAFLFIEKQFWWLAVGLGVLTFLSCVARPEAVIYGAGLYFALAVYCLSPAQNVVNIKAKFLKLIVSSGVVVFLGLIYLTWKYNYFGYILPNPYYVKSNKVSLAGLPEVTEYLTHLFKWFAPLFLAGLILIFIGKVREGAIFARIRKGLTELWSLFTKTQSRAKILLTIAPPLLALAYYSTIIHEVGGAFRFSYPTYFYFVLMGGIFFSVLYPSGQIKGQIFICGKKIRQYRKFS